MRIDLFKNDLISNSKRFKYSVYWSSTPNDEIVMYLKCLFAIVFLRYRYKNERLSPTRVVICQKKLKTDYTVMGRKSSHLATPALRSSFQHDWIWDDKNGVYHPWWHNLAPGSIVGLSMCKRTTKCLPQICKCKEKTFVCSQSRHCQSYENSEENLYLKDFVANC